MPTSSPPPPVAPLTPNQTQSIVKAMPRSTPLSGARADRYTTQLPRRTCNKNCITEPAPCRTADARKQSRPSGSEVGPTLVETGQQLHDPGPNWDGVGRAFDPTLAEVGKHAEIVTSLVESSQCWPNPADVNPADVNIGRSPSQIWLHSAKICRTRGRPLAAFGRNPRNFADSKPNLAECSRSLAELGPNRTQAGRFRAKIAVSSSNSPRVWPNWARIRPSSAAFGPISAKIGPNSTKPGPSWAKHRLRPRPSGTLIEQPRNENARKSMSTSVMGTVQMAMGMAPWWNVLKKGIDGNCFLCVCV